MKKQKNHQGKTIEKVLKESGMTIASVAKKMGVTRPTVYKIFEQNELRYETRLILGEILKHNFIEEIDGTAKVNKDKQEEEIQRWKNKYIELLEEYNKLLKAKK